MFQREQTNQLYLKAKVELCDYTHRIYAQPVDGAKVLRKNQANKWEVKMLCGPEYLSRPVSYTHLTLPTILRV